MGTKDGKGSEDLSDPEMDLSKLRRELFQEGTKFLTTIRSPSERSLARNNLFVLAGPTGAGKTTVQQKVNDFFELGVLAHVDKDNTRPKREVVDGAHIPITREEYKRRKKAGTYVHTYSTNYDNEKGQSKRVFYGIPKDPLLEKLRSSDALLTLTDPASYITFEAVAQELAEKANIIPVIITTDKPDDLTLRLEDRLCSPDERARRLKQASPQWDHFNEFANDVDHVIINNSPESLMRSRIRESKITQKIEGETHKAIDDTLRKFASIVHFYQYLKNAAHYTGNLFDVHNAFRDWVCVQIFGIDYTTLANNLKSSSTRVGLNQSAQLIQRIKQETRKSTQVDHIFGELAATSIRYKDGIATVRFNDVIKKSNPTDGKYIFSMLLPQHGIWTECGTRRYALTERPTEGDIYAIDMKIV
ncbi:hypothetical protein KY349_01755 [Candidatus Woesearchaeota archaeon]|nr:hypothetical protein [Candidatus Woesearchaeota archaeon]